MLISFSKFPTCVREIDPNEQAGTFIQVERTIHKRTLQDKQNTFVYPIRKTSSIMFNNINQRLPGRIVEILFYGFNIHAKRIKRRRAKYFIDVHKSEIFICHEIAANQFKSRIHKRRLLFFSHNSSLLHLIERNIKNFKLPDTYTGKGLYTRTDPFKLKRGKHRK